MSHKSVYHKRINLTLWYSLLKIQSCKWYIYNTVLSEVMSLKSKQIFIHIKSQKMKRSPTQPLTQKLAASCDCQSENNDNLASENFTSMIIPQIIQNQRLVHLQKLISANGLHYTSCSWMYDFHKNVLINIPSTQSSDKCTSVSLCTNYRKKNRIRQY